MSVRGPACDPRNLIRESYRIDGITEAECRSIFLDWALELSGAALPGHVEACLSLYAIERQDHPMTTILQEAQNSAPSPKRRGGRRTRRANGTAP